MSEIIEEQQIWRPTPGWHKSVSNTDYHRGGGTGSSRLKTLIEQTGAHFDYQKKNPKPPSKSMGLGTATHSLVLEPDKFHEDIAVLPEGLDLRTKADKLFKLQFDEDNLGKTIITPQQFEAAKEMAHNVLEHPIASLLLQDGISESSIYWWYKSMDTDDNTQYKELVKVRPDRLSKTYPICMDLKTTDDATYSGFIKNIENYYYHLSAAMYLEGINQCRPLLEELGHYAYTKFVLLCVENEPPYVVGLYEFSKEYIEIGTILYRRAMLKLQQSRAENWPGLPEEVRVIEPPGYSRKAFIV